MAEFKALDVVDRNEIRWLLEQDPAVAVSLFHPTERVAIEPEQNSLRLKNLLSQAHDALSGRGLRRPDVEKLLGPLYELLGDSYFWRHQLDGLAIYRAEGVTKTFRLPFAVDERVVVGDRFHVKPLVPVLSAGGHFYILALSQNQIRLLRATRFSVTEIPLDDLGVPRSIDEALRYDDVEKTGLQHYPTAGPSATGSTQAAGRSGRGQHHMFHGHGPGDEDVKKDVARYFQAVDAGLSRVLATERAPLVLAGVDYLHPLYRQASGYRDIVARGIEGNPEQLSPQELQQRAWPLVEPRLRASIEHAKQAFAAKNGTGLASTDLPEVLDAAHQGRIEALMVRRGDEVWGTYDPESRRVVPDGSGTRDAPDLLDLASKLTLEQAGDVYLLDGSDMPADTPIAAVFRF